MALTSPTLQSTITLSGVDCLFHISLDPSGSIWVSDNVGNLVQTDPQGNLLRKILTGGGPEGYHTVTKKGQQINAFKNLRFFSIRKERGGEIFLHVQTRDWKPLSIHPSRYREDILVGMRWNNQAKVVKYNKTGKIVRRSIQWLNDTEEELYSLPHYITENINGDICVSDLHKQAVVVVDELGEHKFFYRGSQEETFRPYGICTDDIGYILVCDISSESVHLLELDGQLVSLILTSQHGIEHPRSVCVNINNDLCVGELHNTVRVYKYLNM